MYLSRLKAPVPAIIQHVYLRDHITAQHSNPFQSTHALVTSMRGLTADQGAGRGKSGDLPSYKRAEREHAG
jgi:hypothetical protein